VESSFETPVSSSNFPSFLSFLSSKLFCKGFSHVSGTNPQVGGVDVDVVESVVVEGVVDTVEVVVVEVVDTIEVVVACEVDEVPTGGEPHPTRVAATTMSSKLPPMVVAAPPKLSTPKPIQSRDCGKSRPVGTPEPIF
jgi:hypothetical protein